MTYNLKWHPKSFKNLEKLPKEMSQRVIDKFDLVVQDPFRYLEHYEGSDLFKLRIGDYRALIKVIFEDNLLLVQAFDHRGKIYEK